MPRLRRGRGAQVGRRGRLQGSEECLGTPMRSYYDEKTDSFVCPHCKKSYALGRDLRDHILEKHCKS